MRTLIAICILLLSFNAISNNKHEVTFQHLTSLVGQWQGKYPDGTTIGVEYKLISGGYALMELWSMSPTHNSITIYSMDDGALNLRHFCPQGNQVQLVLSDKKWSYGQYSFDFVNASNSDTPNKSHLFNTYISFTSVQKFIRQDDYKFTDMPDDFDIGQKVAFTKKS